MEQAGQQARTPAHRDMMYCHECSDEWYRDEHGLTCPECGSDFTEIIEENHDPRDHEVHHHDGDDDMDSMPSLEEAPQRLHPFGDHNPWRDEDVDDPAEDDISNLQWRQIGPGRYAVTGTVYRTVSPNGTGGGGAAIGIPNVMGTFASMLNGIVGGGRGLPGPMQNPDQEQRGRDMGDQAMPGADPGSRSGSGTLPGGQRFTYTSNARLFPRDANGNDPHVHPNDELSSMLTAMFDNIGAYPGPPGPHDRDPYDNPPGMPLNPLNALLSNLMPMLTGGQHGDAVYSQEALDRVISQLMEQNATGNAPGPATQADIDSLPRRHVTKDMLGADGKADCSICMDSVELGEEVAELPCHHWFHHPCIAAWLGEHDTCPHCRQGITPPREGGAQDDNSHASAPANASNAGDHPPPMPGTFSEDTHEHQFAVPNSPDQAHSSSTDQGGSSTGGLRDRIGRGWFGSSS